MNHKLKNWCNIENVTKVVTFMNGMLYCMSPNPSFVYKQDCKQCNLWYGAQTSPRHSLLSKVIHFYGTCITVFTFMPTRKVWPFPHWFSQNSQILKTLWVDTLLGIFPKLGNKCGKYGWKFISTTVIKYNFHCTNLQETHNYLNGDTRIPCIPDFLQTSQEMWYVYVEVHFCP